MPDCAISPSMSLDSKNTYSGFAPATVANVAVGFDVLGYAIESEEKVGDEVTLRIATTQGVTLGNVTGCLTRGQVPSDPLKNTATRAAIELLRLCGIDPESQFLTLDLHKGISMGSGMGGSAASAVAAVKATAKYIAAHSSENSGEKFQDINIQLEAALVGESMASDSRQADNVAPALLGGLVLIPSTDPIRVVRLPVPKGLWSVVIHPDCEVRTREARRLLSETVPRATWARQQARLGAWVSALYIGDIELLKSVFQDEVIEPQRSKLIPGFYEVKTAALKAGALGFSISGSGPSVFAWTQSENQAREIARLAQAVFHEKGLTSQTYVNALESAHRRDDFMGSV